jgi:branched-chain amino acid transport system substrate-binding protein
MRKHLTAGLASLTLAVTACGAGGNGSTSTGTGPVTIGVSISLTGDFSADGKALEQGYELWAADVNARGGLVGRHVQFKFVDDASSAQQVVTNYQNLISTDHVNLTFGPYSSLLTIPASGIASRYGYAFPEPAGGGPQVFQRGLRNLFFVQPAAVVDNLVSYTTWLRSLPAGQRPRTAAYATEDDPFTQPQVETAKARLEAAGVTTAYYKVYPAESIDIGPIALGIAQGRPDVVILGSQLPDGIAFVKTFQQQHYDPKSLIETAGPDQGSQFSDKVGKSATEGIMVPAGWWPNAKTAGNEQFVTAFLATHGGDPSSISSDSAEAYSVGQVVQQAADRIHSVDNAALIDALHHGTYDTIQGKLAFDSVGKPTGSSFLVQWQGGSALPVFPAAVAVARPEYPKPSWP